MLFIAVVLFLLTLCTCLVAGTQFAVAYAQNQAVSLDGFLNAFTLFYKHPAALAAGLPFALTLLAILSSMSSAIFLPAAIITSAPPTLFLFPFRRSSARSARSF